MGSPFPGMDPFLEDVHLWPAFQHQLVASLYQILLPGLIDRYRARVSQRGYVLEQPLFTSVIREEHVEEVIEIRQRTDGRLITLIDIASPTNKTTQRGRAAYWEQRKDARSHGANVVEIDLVLQGKPLLDLSRDGLPECDYATTITRNTQPERYEIYTTTLRKRLPRFKIPLAADDRDTVLDLQLTFNRAFEQGNFASRIDYKKDPAVPLTDDDRRWLHELLTQLKLR